MIPTQPRRQGFTITELLVAMALIVFIMYVLAEAFSAGAGAFRRLKAIGDMNEKLRSASTVLRRYLSADHFEGKKRLSDPDFWKDGPPSEGFFRIWQGTKGTYEGVDSDSNESWRATDHMIHFTAKLRGNNRGNFFRASVPAGSPLLFLPFPDSRFQEGNEICSPWAEVCFFLKDTLDVTKDPENPGVGDQPLYNLHMRQRLLLQDNDLLTTLLTAAGQSRPLYAAYKDYLELSCNQDTTSPTNLYYNSPADVTMPPRRFGLAAAQQGTSFAHAVLPTNLPTLYDDNTALEGSDIVLTNVLSMEVRVLLSRDSYASDAAVDFASLHDPLVTDYEMGSTAFGTAKVFDTWSSKKDNTFDYTDWGVRPASLPAAQQPAQQAKVIPLYLSQTTNKPIRIRAIKITLRIWDPNTRQTRQTSIVQDL